MPSDLLLGAASGALIAIALSCMWHHPDHHRVSPIYPGLVAAVGFRSSRRAGFLLSV